MAPKPFNSHTSYWYGLAIREFTPMQDKQLTKHFKLSELNPLGLTLTPTIEANLLRLATNLEHVRTYLGNRAITITSGYRTVVIERQKGRSGNSRHTLGEAADFVAAGLTPKQVQQQLDKWWKGGMGYGNTFTHLDIRHLSTTRPTVQRFARWHY